MLRHFATLHSGFCFDRTFCNGLKLSFLQGVFVGERCVLRSIKTPEGRNSRLVHERFMFCGSSLAVVRVALGGPVAGVEMAMAMAELATSAAEVSVVVAPVGILRV